MHPNIRLALKLSVTPAVLGVVFLALFLLLRQEPEVTELSELQSPDGQRVARLIFTVYVGHLGGDPARYEVYVGNASEPHSSQTLAFAGEGGDYKIEWSGARELRVAFSSAARIEFQQPQARDISVRYGVAGW